ncbi:E3 binding domain-containing protein, partial [Streptococcus pseudoporcinus]|uniref:E3 binding domain-containing protein n=1 Tax=Streptococcus pseudoporcinus TaxID=361101 RepID=UPI0035B5FA48
MKKKAATTSQTVVAQVDSSTDIRLLAVPRVRKYARSKHVDLHAVNGTGNNGKITMEDIDNFLANGGATQVAQAKEEISERHEEVPEEKAVAASVATKEEFAEVVEKIPAIRRTIADALAKSSSEVAQVTVFDQAEVDAL